LRQALKTATVRSAKQSKVNGVDYRRHQSKGVTLTSRPLMIPSRSSASRFLPLLALSTVVAISFVALALVWPFVMSSKTGQWTPGAELIVRLDSRFVIGGKDARKDEGR
jgi:hypothetical protein